MNQPALMSGPNAVRAASSLRPPRAAAQPVPFPWDLPPKNSKPVYEVASLASPAQGATPSLILEYQVPDGFQFVLRGRINAFTGALVAGSGDALWTTDVNVTPGIATPQGYPIEGFAGEKIGVGSFTEGPFPVYGCLIFDPNDIVRVKVANIGVAVGAPNFFNSALMGWIWPVK